MRFWVRELAGWLLVAAGLLVFYSCIGWLFAEDNYGRPTPRYFETALAMPIGFIVFRGGIHLLKVAMAARVCMQIQDRLKPDMQTKPAAQAPARSQRPVPAQRRP